MLLRRAMWLLISLFAVLDVGKGPAKDAPPTEENEPALTAEDKQLLNSLIGDLLIDPKGREYVNAMMPLERGIFTPKESIEGWLVFSGNGKEARVYNSDGTFIILDPGNSPSRSDLVAFARERYPKKVPSNDKPIEWVESDLVMAAWLHRIGEDGLSARALAIARKKHKDPVNHLRRSFVESLIPSMVIAFVEGSDGAAREYAERLMRIFPREMTDKQSCLARRVLVDLQRRQTRGKVRNQVLWEQSNVFERWSTEKKLAYLIEALGDVRTDADWMFVLHHSVGRMLMEIGDDAVPVLLRVLETDSRLSRSVWDKVGVDVGIVDTRRLALEALVAILGPLQLDLVQYAVPAEEAQDEVKRKTRLVKVYWDKYGRIPLEERMMMVLTDRTLGCEIKREVVRKLGFGRLNVARYRERLLTRFSNPTVAEAILQAMDDEVQQYLIRTFPQGNLPKDWSPSHIECDYLPAIATLEDRRIGKELAKRARLAKNIHSRVDWARTAFDLGEHKPIDDFIEDFLQNKIPISRMHSKGIPFYEVVELLMRLDHPIAECALMEILNPQHTHFQRMKERVLWYDEPFRRYCSSHSTDDLQLALLRKCLDDDSPTGRKVLIKEGQLTVESVEESGVITSEGSPPLIPSYLADSSLLVDKAPERKYDLGAQALRRSVVGLPLYHPLFKDADRRLKALKQAYDRYESRYRRANSDELFGLGADLEVDYFLPDFPTLDRPATEADVKQRRAIFHLNGKGKRAAIQLPASAILKSAEKEEYPERMLIVQAEVDANGETIYGVIMRHDIRSIRASEVTQVKSLEQLAKEENARLTQDKSELD